MTGKTSNLRKYTADALLYLAGSLLYALSVNIFTAPNRIAPGGMTGLATVLNYLFSLPIGTTIWVLNLPLLIAAWFRLGREFTLRTLAATTMTSLLVDATAPFVPPFRGNMILVCIFGGVLAGAGLALIFIRGATTGGSDVVARLLERRFEGVPIGRLMLAVDGVVVLIAAFAYRDVESALYAIVMIFVSAEVIDTLVYGRSGGKMLLIMSRESGRIAQRIMQQMERGVTILKSTSAYTGDDRQVLLCAVSRSEVYPLRTLVSQLDPQAFIIIAAADEVRGLGFAAHQ